MVLVGSPDPEVSFGCHENHTFPAGFRTALTVMNPDRKTHPVVLVACAILAISYLAGYAVIRRDCTTLGANWFITPSYLSTNTSLQTLYRPYLRFEKLLGCGQFTTSPWGMSDP